MQNNDKMFNHFLDQYVHRVIEKYIDRIDKGAQTKLIRLYGELYDQLYAESPDSATTQQDALKESNCFAERKEIARRLLTSYQGRIRALRENIQQMDMLISRAEQRLSQTTTQTRLINQYQTVQKGFTLSLERAHFLCQNKLFNQIT